jgi:hypothetical protein
VTFRTGFPHYYHHHRYFPYCPPGYGFCNTYAYGAYGYPGYGYAGYGYPYYGYGDALYWGSASYDQSSDASQQYLTQQNQELQNQLGELSQQVAELRGQQEALLRPPAPATPPAPPRAAHVGKPVASEPTTLVYSDGHTEEVSNYAITGKTLWIFNEQRARRVPLSSIDVEATRRANEDRGVDFAVPSQP